MNKLKDFQGGSYSVLLIVWHRNNYIYNTKIKTIEIAPTSFTLIRYNNEMTNNVD